MLVFPIPLAIQSARKVEQPLTLGSLSMREINHPDLSRKLIMAVFIMLTNVAPTNFIHGQADLTVQVGQECLLCFMRGTMIRTPEGESPVEALKCGDLVMTTDGRAMPVRWIGRQTVSSIFGDPLRFRPIRIKAGALGEGVPARDLLLSPDHAILLEGVLVQAGALVNGTSIVREKDVPEIFVVLPCRSRRSFLDLCGGYARGNLHRQR